MSDAARVAAPPYFSKVAEKAMGQWEKLEADPELAAPWLQLFNQVQSPRHVLSELLQNAEDAKARTARCLIEDGVFKFEHDGQDFDEAALGSLCRFGYSNKRSLQTIGFRGVGFKTTFSVGPHVAVTTPTLAFAFEKGRFTFPSWTGSPSSDGLTRVSVPVADSERARAIEDSLAEWSNSPIPLLFFNNVESLTLGGRSVRVVEREAGPVPDSTWITLKADTVHRVLLVRSSALPLPDDCVEEIREERNSAEFESVDCRIDLVFDPALNGRVYSILPTSLSTRLPFAFNAPFVQDPSRFGIKDPSRSPTNRWLIERVGALAAETMLAWLGNGNLEQAQRAEAYGLLALDLEDRAGGLQGAVRTLVIDAMFEGLNAGPSLLTESGLLAEAEHVADVPAPLIEALGTETAREIFGNARANVLSHAVPDGARDALAAWELLDRSTPTSILSMLDRRATLPRPQEIERLAAFWACLVEMHSKRSFHHKFDYPMVPTARGAELRRPQDVMSSMAVDERLTAEELSLLHRHVRIVDRTFLDYLSPEADEIAEFAEPTLAAAREALRRLEFERFALQRVFEQASRAVAAEGTFQDSLALVSIAAKTGLNVPNTFEYLCRDGNRRTADLGLLIPDARYEDDLLPSTWLNGRAIDDRYLAIEGLPPSALASWLDSPRSKLRKFPAPERQDNHLYSAPEVRSLVRARDGSPPNLSNCKYWIFRDARWPEALTKHWERLAKSDDETWARVAEAWCEGWRPEDAELATSRILRQWGGAVPKPSSEGLVSTWLHQLRVEKCIFEQRSGRPEYPSALMRLTQATRDLQNVERFVHPRIDRDEASGLLDLLGVCSQPDNADKLLARLRQLAQSGQPPLTALLDLYRAIDGTISRLDERECAEVRQCFEQSRLILGQDGAWHDAHSIFQSNDDEIPGAAVIHGELRTLALWDRVGVGRVPSLEAAVEWLRALPIERAIPEADLRRLRAILPRLASDAWHDIGRWLTLGGEWVPTSTLRYYVAERGDDGPARPKPFPAFGRLTADFTMLPAEQRSGLRSDLQAWDDAVSYDLAAEGRTEIPSPQWVADVAVCVLRAERPATYRDESLWGAGQEAARLMRRLRFFHAKEISIAPYIGGTQAGADQFVRAVVRDGVAYVAGSEPSHTSELVQALEGLFDTRDLRLAVRYCCGRSSPWIEAYFSERFTLASLKVVEHSDVLVEGIQTAEESADESQPKNHEMPTSKTDEGAGSEIEEPPSQSVGDKEVEIEALGVPLSTAQAHPQRQAPKKHAIELLMANHGFIGGEGGRFHRAEDNLIVRRESSSGAWRLLDVNDTEIARFIELAEPVESGPVLKAEDWLTVQKLTSRCWLLALRGDGKLQAVRGDRALSELRATAATYRISGEIDDAEKDGMPI